MQLYKDHEVPEEKLRQLKPLVFGNSVWSHSAGDKLIDLIDSLRDELNRHVEQEESFLFPAMLQMMGYLSEPIAVMQQEHAQLMEQLERLREEVQRSRGDENKSPALKKMAREVTQALYDHMYKENRLLFPMARYVLTREQIRGEHSDFPQPKKG